MSSTKEQKPPELIEFRKAIGAKLKEVREIKGLTLKEVGQRVGLATHTVNSIEEGKWPFNIDVLHSLTKALDFDIVFEV